MIARVGKAIVRAYVNSLVWFTIGCVAGGVWVAVALVIAGVLR